MTARLCVLLGLLLSSCAEPQYPNDFLNDLPYPVVVTGCGDCTDGRRVEPDARLMLTLNPGMRLTISRTDGTRIGCGYAVEGGGSTSEAVPAEASSYVGSVCE